MHTTYSIFIQEVLRGASKIATESFGKVTGTVKAGDNNQVLTETDLAIEKLLVEKVKATYPDHSIIDEEAGVIDKQSSLVWVIDPIDGTSNFANGIPTYGVMIGLLEKGVPVAGGIALPGFAQIITAEKGKGAWCNGEAVRVTKEENLLSVLVAYGIDGHQENPSLTREESALLGEIVLNIRNLRSSNSAFDTVMVARGSYGASLNRTSKIWDNVAQQVIIEEAGGVYTDYYGKMIDYSNPLEKAAQNFTWCMGPAPLHARLQEIIHETR